MQNLIINISGVVPPECLAYTEVFRTIRIEHGIIAMAFTVLGVICGYYYGRH
jgi:hypothetical protein